MAKPPSKNKQQAAKPAPATKSRPSAKPGPSTKPARKRRAGSRASYETVAVETRNRIALVTLVRPDVHNAFNETLIAELTDVLRRADADADVRAVILLAAGKSFCAGADLNWMKKMAQYGHDENLADATALAEMLRTLNELSKPTIARVHGNAFGGGVGLIACCDIAIASQDATFALSETRLGLIPATVSPYVIEAIGARHARRYFLSAERFTAAEAYRLGLVHDIVLPHELDDRINEILGALFLCGPRAQAAAKELVRAVSNRAIDERLIAGTAQRIAAIRATDEAREGVAAFLDKRAAEWTRGFADDAS